MKIYIAVVVKSSNSRLRVELIKTIGSRGMLFKTCAEVQTHGAARKMITIIVSENTYLQQSIQQTLHRLNFPRYKIDFLLYNTFIKIIRSVNLFSLTHYKYT